MNWRELSRVRLGPPRLEKHLGGQKGIESSVLKYQEQQGMDEREWERAHRS